MIQNISLNVPPTIEFGAGTFARLIEHTKRNDRIYLIVDAPVLPAVEPLIDRLRGTGKAVSVSSDVVPEPPIDSLVKLLEPARAFEPDCVVGVGGGSTLDCAKLTAVMLDGKQRVADMIGIGNVTGRTVRLIAAPTTSGTGSEVTPIAVVTDTEASLKKGVVSNHLIPDVAIVDPELTVGKGPMLTAVTGMDAITHCIEAYTNRIAHPVIDMIALEGIKIMTRNLYAAVSGGSLEARAAMSLGSLYGGLCLGPVNTAAVHALAYPLGGVYKISHGTSNSVLLPFVMRFNMASCLQKYSEVARAMGISGSDQAELAEKAVQGIRELSNRCEIPRSLKELHIPRDSIGAMAEAALQVQRLLQNNPREVTLDDAKAIYTAAWEGAID